MKRQIGLVASLGTALALAGGVAVFAANASAPAPGAPAADASVAVTAAENTVATAPQWRPLWSASEGPTRTVRAESAPPQPRLVSDDDDDDDDDDD